MLLRSSPLFGNGERIPQQPYLMVEKAADRKLEIVEIHAKYTLQKLTLIPFFLCMTSWDSLHGKLNISHYLRQENHWHMCIAAPQTVVDRSISKRKCLKVLLEVLNYA